MMVITAPPERTLRPNHLFCVCVCVRTLLPLWHAGAGHAPTAVHLSLPTRAAP
jgi:hypothetical protein